MTLDVLYEDNHLLAVNKPAGISSAHDEPSMVDHAKEYLKSKYHKPGNVFLGVVHRLDKPVSGVLLFARTSKAAARISEQFREHTIQKTYLAICEQPPRALRSHGWSYEDHHQMEDHLFHDDQSKIVKVVDTKHLESQYALTEYRVEPNAGLFLMYLTPKTGRRHQLRVQLASRGAPILGDRKYGSRIGFHDSIALHARSLVFQHPVSQQTITIMAELPKTMKAIIQGVT